MEEGKVGSKRRRRRESFLSIDVSTEGILLLPVYFAAIGSG